MILYICEEASAMISVPEALALVNTHVAPLDSETIALSEALNRVLSEDTFSPIDMPPFNQSAMDGYAVYLHANAHYSLVGEIKAGDALDIQLKEGEAVRIFTGAMVPGSANCVVKQEIVEQLEGQIQVLSDLSKGENIRPQGEQIRMGGLVFRKGTKLNSGAIGHLATLGITSVNVHRKPKIGLLATGNELQTAGQPLSPGKIYESNTIMLRSALIQLGYDCSIHFVKDDYSTTRNTIAQCLESLDVLLLSGGISVGDYDFVERALTELNVQCHFYKVKQKPGKPLYFGTSKSTTIFALPGNPAAALTCFYVYVRKALKRLQNEHPSNFIQHLPLAGNYSKKSGLTHFLKAKIVEGKVHILSAQSSAMLSAFSEANCLVIAEESRDTWEAGEEIEILLLPG